MHQTTKDAWQFLTSLGYFCINKAIKNYHAYAMYAPSLQGLIYIQCQLCGHDYSNEAAATPNQLMQ